MRVWEQQLPMLTGAALSWCAVPAEAVSVAVGATGVIIGALGAGVASGAQISEGNSVAPSIRSIRVVNFPRR